MESGAETTDPLAAAGSEERPLRAPEPPAADDTLILLAARGMLLFPRVVLPIVVGRDRSVRAVQAAVQAERPIGILLQKNEDEQTPGPDDLYTVGTVAAIVRYITAPDGSHHVIAQGETRFRVLEYMQVEPYLMAPSRGRSILC